VEQLSIDERLTIANMTTEWGALAGVFPIDEKTLKWLYERQGRLVENIPVHSLFRLLSFFLMLLLHLEKN